MTLRLRFWLVMMDATRAVFGFGSRPYTWALERASDETYRDAPPLGEPAGEEPF